MKISSTIRIALLLAISYFSTQITAQEDVQVETTKITESVYMLTGNGGNVGLCVGEDGVFMIDNQYAVMSKKLLAAIRAISDKPLKFVFNTHWHGDHTGGNENMAKEGAIIVAHENVYQRMSTEQFLKAFSRKVPASPKAALPIITFSEDIDFQLNGEDIMAFHVHNAHTDGDAFVYFAQSNVIHMGDTYLNGRYPFVDASSGGTLQGIIRACDAALMLADDETVIIPGHGNISNKEELTTYRTMLLTMRDSVKTQIKAGKTLDEIKAMKLGQDYDAKYGVNFIKPEQFIGFIYESLQTSQD